MRTLLKQEFGNIESPLYPRLKNLYNMIYARYVLFTDFFSLNSFSFASAAFIFEFVIFKASSIIGQAWHFL